MLRSRLVVRRDLRIPEILLMIGLFLTIMVSCAVFYKLHSGSGIEIATQIIQSTLKKQKGLNTNGSLLRGSKTSNSSFVCRAEVPMSIFSIHRDHRMGKPNDNYCDCYGTTRTTTDEPATSACSNIVRDKTFFCGWKPEDTKIYSTVMAQTSMLGSYPFYPKLVYASRVHDGVCDCCDGADEVGNAFLALPCLNRCDKSIEEYEHYKQEKREVYRAKMRRENDEL